MENKNLFSSANVKAFAEEVATKVAEKLGKEVEVIEVPKANGVKLIGLNAKLSESITPTLYIEYFYESFIAEENTKEEVINEIYEAIKEHENKMPAIKIPEITSWDSAKESIIMKCVSIKLNKEKLEDVPHLVYGDLAVVFRYKVTLDETNGEGTILISNALMEMWKITTKDLYEAAQKPEPVVKKMSDVIREMTGQDIVPKDCNQMYAVTYESKFLGATAILNNELLKKFSDMIGGDYYIIPSSIHELIFVKAEKTTIDEYKELAEIVETVNTTSLKVEDILNDHPYLYDSSVHKLYNGYYKEEMKLDIPGYNMEESDSTDTLTKLVSSVVA